MRVTYTVEIDEGKFDDWVRTMYDPPLDPVEGEPTPGRHLARGLIDEATGFLAEKRVMAVDTAWWDSPGVTDISVEVDTPCGCEHCSSRPL